MPKLARYRAGYLLSKFVVFSFLFWTLYTTNRFHIAVDLSSNRSQRTSKYGKNKEVAHSPAARVPLFFVLITFWCHLLSITEQTYGNMERETRVDKGYPRWWNCKRVFDWSAWMSLKGVFTWHRGELSRRREFTPVPSQGSIFVYMIPPQMSCRRQSP